MFRLTLLPTVDESSCAPTTWRPPPEEPAHTDGRALVRYYEALQYYLDPPAGHVEKPVLSPADEMRIEELMTRLNNIKAHYRREVRRLRKKPRTGFLRMQLHDLCMRKLTRLAGELIWRFGVRVTGLNLE